MSANNQTVIHCTVAKPKITEQESLKGGSNPLNEDWGFNKRNQFLCVCTYCNVLGGSIHDGTLLHSKSQYTTVKHSQKLFEHTYTSDLYGTGTLTPIEFFQQDLLWQSSNTHSHSCSQKASKHTRSIRRRAIGPLAHHNGTSAYSPSLTCSSPDDWMSSTSTV
jgi:hypothetical protein